MKKECITIKTVYMPFQYTLCILGIFAATALSPAAGASSSRWGVLSFPGNSTITGADFFSEDTGFVVTVDGKVGRTTDGCRTWKTVELGKGIRLDDCSFFNKKSGMACGDGGSVFLTRDGGVTWKDVSLPDSLVKSVGIAMLDEQTAIVTGMRAEVQNPLFGVVYRTTDAGKSWTKLDVTGLGFGNLTKKKGGYIAFPGYGFLYESRDKGETWQTRKLRLEKPTRAVAFVGKEGLMVGNEAMCAVSHDEGRSWITAKVGAEPSAHFTSVIMHGPQFGFLAGTGGSLYSSFDAGRTWKKETLPREPDILALEIGGKRLYAFGSFGYILTREIN